MKTTEEEFNSAFGDKPETMTNEGEDNMSAMADATNMAESGSAEGGVQDAPAVAVVIAPADKPESDGMADSAVVADTETENADAGNPDGEMMGGEDQTETTDTETMSPEDMQRQRSWEGRLKKREEELAAKEASMSQPTSTIGGEAVASVLARANELRGSGELDDMVQSFVKDFGVDTVAVMVLLGSAIAAPSPVASGGNDAETAKRIDALVEDFKGALSAMHLGAISDAHEDYEDVVKSESFTSWVNGLDEQEKAKVTAALEHGTAGKIIKVLSMYKDSLAPKPDENPDGMAPNDMSDAEDAAGAVRGSSPLRLPTRAPASPDDEYKSAWERM